MSPINFSFESSVSTASLDQRQQLRKQQQYEDVRSPFNKVLIIGLGQLGLPVAKYVNEKGFDTYVYDSHQAIEHAEKTAGVKRGINFSEFDVYIYVYPLISQMICSFHK